MEDNSILLALVLTLFQIFTIILFKKTEKKNKKSLSHYEAIADEHTKRIYDPVSACVKNIWGLLFAGFFLSNKALIILFIFWNVLQTISAKLSLLISSVDIVQLKQGLISMFPNDFNAYFSSWNVDIELTDYTGLENEDKNIKMLKYKINDKIVREHTIDITDLSEEQIKDVVSWNKKRFKDYLRYIPKETFSNNNYQELQENVDSWFVYLDDIRGNF